jgi:hypothetical protein
MGKKLQRGGGSGGNNNKKKNANHADEGVDTDDWSRSVDHVGAADDLSENHTINDMVSNGGGNGNGNGNGTFASMEDDVDWDMNDDDDDDNQYRQLNKDVTAAASAEVSQQTRQQRLQDALCTCTDYPSEKRSTKRQLMLQRWFQAFTQYATMPPYDVVYKYKDELIIACSQNALLKGSASEQYAACRVLEALAVLVSDLDLYEQVQGRLVRVIQATQRATAVRAASLKALGMIVFCLQHNGHDDDVLTEKTLDVCEEIIVQPRYRNQSTPPALVAAALRVWTLLATTLNELYVSGKDDTSTGRGLLLLPRLLQIMESEPNSSNSNDLALHEAAGLTVAYIHEARLKLGIQATSYVDDHYVKNGPDTASTITTDTTFNDDGDGTSIPPPASSSLNTTDLQYKIGSWEGSEWADIMDELTQLLYGKAHASGHYLSKKVKKEQRHVFRDYLVLVQDNEFPLEVVTFRGGTLELNCYKDIVPLEACKNCLQGGFQIQLLTNPTLQTMFGANGASLAQNNPYSQLEKRLLLSKTSEVAKQKDQHRHKHRDKRHNVKTFFLTVDEE